MEISTIKTSITPFKNKIPLVLFIKNKQLKMNIHKLKKVLRLVPSLSDINQGNEFFFTQKVKDMLPRTNFELLGEQLVLGKDNTIGKCDLWLANAPNNFLLSLELKVGGPGDTNKQKFLKTQVYKYTDYMGFYYPGCTVYGIGAYKCIKVSANGIIRGTEIKFVDYISPSNRHSDEIEKLKARMQDECLN
jgi:hypothetical protein